MKIKIIIYWVTTVLIALETLAGGVTNLAHGRASVVSGPFVADVITHLGYPVYLLTILGVWKLAGGVTLLVPGFPRLKEWAYAGIFLRTNRCRCIVRGARRDHRRSDCAARSNWSGGRFVGASTAKSYSRRSLPCQ